jgi:BirA family biotin operon repressor/biotin-[acetyl-CoA-carboxylase] ligase
LNKIQPKTFFVGKKAVFMTTCHSTNDIASEIIQNNEYSDGQIIVTDFQEKGRGQFGNSWESTPGQNLLMSLIIDTSFLEIKKSFFLNIWSSLGVLEAIENVLFDQKITLNVKWPNDIYLDSKKTAGILIENQIKGNTFGTSIIGIGLNINQSQFENQKATSLSYFCNGKEFDKYLILEEVLESLERNYFLLKKGKFELLHEMYLKRLYRLGEKSFFKDINGIFEGVITGIKPEGLLLVKKENEIFEYNIKQIEFL